MEFVAKIDPEGDHFLFASKYDKEVYQEMVRFYKQTGKYFRFVLLDVDPKSTENQIGLFKRLVIMISESSGMTFKETYDALHKECGFKETVPGLFGPSTVRFKDVSELTNKEFDRFMSSCVLKANEFYNMNLVLYSSEILGTVLTEKTD